MAVSRENLDLLRESFRQSLELRAAVMRYQGIAPIKQDIAAIYDPMRDEVIVKEVPPVDAPPKLTGQFDLDETAEVKVPKPIGREVDL